MQCTLLIPHLWWPFESDGAAQPPGFPHLERLLARARRSHFCAVSVEGWLCQAFEVERQHDWPVAAHTLACDGGEPGEAYWLRADPLHLRPHRDRLIGLDGNALAVTTAEAAALTATLNGHFAGEGLRFSAPHPARWYLRLEADPDITTHAPGEAAGGANPWLPGGRNALRWHAICNEIQMLLHEHPVNQARAARGAPEINSVWLWGGGRRTAVPGSHFAMVWSDDALAQALAASAAVACESLPPDAARWLELLDTGARPGGCHLLTFLEPARSARTGETGAWRDALAHFDRHWAGPLLDAVSRRRLDAIALVAPAAASCERFDFGPLDRLKFWRANRPLSFYAQVESA